MGRSVSIIYACIGIPLLLMVLADLGKLFTRIIKHVLKKIHQLLNAKKLKKVRKAGRRATIVQQVRQEMMMTHQTCLPFSLALFVFASLRVCDTHSTTTATNIQLITLE